MVTVTMIVVMAVFLCLVIVGGSDSDVAGGKSDGGGDVFAGGLVAMVAVIDVDVGGVSTNVF
jgi:hypothetical protein